jgi:N-acetylglucosaminyl-diphospho-decaprenol L-rhamnosyltransferase
MTARVRVVTVTYNSSGVLESFLESLAAATDRELDVVVVDNASADVEATRSLAEAYGARVLALPENLGYGTGMNRGVAHGPRADFYVLANPDLTFGTGAIDELLRAAEAEPRSGSLGPAIFNVDGSLYPSARPLPALGTGIGHALFSRTWPSNPWTRSYRMTLADGRSRAVGWLSGACLFVRADVFHAVGGFDERYFMYFEDVDFGRRVGLAGYRNVYVPAARATHHGAHSTSAASTSMERAHHDSAYLYLSDVYSGALLAPLRVALKAGLAVRARRLDRRARNVSG